MTAAAWGPLLGESQPQWQDSGAHHYGDPRAEADAVGHGDVMAALVHLGVIEVRGRDAEALLQGQLTNDIDLLGPRHTVPSAWCSAKGRVLTILRVLKRDTAIYLQLPRECVEPTIARMRMYVLRADARLDDVSEQVLTLGVAGPRVAEQLAASLGEVPLDVDDAVCASDCITVRLPGSAPRFAVLASSDRLRALWQQLAGVAKPVGSNAWRLCDIRAGVPELSDSLADSFLPQMLNLQALRAVSFTKGCYTGQEIVARTQHLGRLKRRLYPAVVEAGKAPAPGDPLYRADTGESAAVGTVVSVASNAAGQWELLAVIQIDAAESGEITLVPASDSRVLALRALPYALDAG